MATKTKARITKGHVRRARKAHKRSVDSGQPVSNGDDIMALLSMLGDDSDDDFDDDPIDALGNNDGDDLDGDDIPL